MPETVSVAERIRRAFEDRDLAVFSSLLAEDVRWGDGGHPRSCRNREQVLALFSQLMAEGAVGEITELVEGTNGILCGLAVDWPEGVSRPWDRSLFHVYLLRDGKIAEIRRYDDRPNAAEAAGCNGDGSHPVTPAAVPAPVMVMSVEPIFWVTDMARARAHYERLGFTTSEYDATYAFAHRDDVNVHLEHTDVMRASSGAIYLHVDDAVELARQWREAGVEVTGPEDFDWGKREGSHVDPDGNLIRFGSAIPR